MVTLMAVSCAKAMLVMRTRVLARSAEMDNLSRLVQGAQGVEPEDVLVLRNAGPKGAPEVFVVSTPSDDRVGRGKRHWSYGRERDMALAQGSTSKSVRVGKNTSA